MYVEITNANGYTEHWNGVERLEPYEHRSGEPGFQVVWEGKKFVVRADQIETVEPDRDE